MRGKEIKTVWNDKGRRPLSEWEARQTFMEAVLKFHVNDSSGEGLNVFEKQYQTHLDWEKLFQQYRATGQYPIMDWDGLLAYDGTVFSLCKDGVQLSIEPLSEWSLVPKNEEVSRPAPVPLVVGTSQSARVQPTRTRRSETACHD